MTKKSIHGASAAMPPMTKADTGDSEKRPIRVILAKPRGFCAGVERAIEIVERALDRYGPPVYVRHEIVHNKRVVEDLRAKGAVFVEELDEIPNGGVTIFSAHGVAEKIENEANLRMLPVLDATCPLVAKVHKEGQRYASQSYEVILIGHAGHPEVEGTMGRINGKVYLVSDIHDVQKLEVKNPKKLAYISQTTLSVDDTREVIEALQSRFPAIIGPDVKDICYATQNRQSAVRLLAKKVDVLLVVGAHNSSNSNRLREIGAESGIDTHMIEDVKSFIPRWLDHIGSVGITSGASTPDQLVQELIEEMGRYCHLNIEEMPGVEENIVFKLPTQLRAEQMSVPAAAD